MCLMLRVDFDWYLVMFGIKTQFDSIRVESKMMVNFVLKLKSQHKMSKFDLMKKTIE